MEETSTLHDVYDRSMVFFAIFSLVAIAIGNARRILFTLRYIRQQPKIHKLMPSGFRNMQLAWISNLWTTAVYLEAISLSDFMVRLGHPVIVEREQRDFYQVAPKAPPKVEAIGLPLILDRLKYQDIPMIVLIVLQSLISFSSYGTVQPASLLVVIITLVSVLNG